MTRGAKRAGGDGGSRGGGAGRAEAGCDAAGQACARRASDAYVLVVGAAIVDDLEHPMTLLAARRTEPPRLAGGWELPGGKVEAGEDAVAALHREVAEELGVGVVLGDEVVAPDGRGWLLPPSHRMRVWLAAVTEGEPQPLEDHDALRRVPLASWRDVEWLPADVPVVEAVVAHACVGPT